MSGTARRAREKEPVITGGVEGNARLTASLAAVLLLLLFLEGVTLLGVQAHLSLHVFLGTVLIPVSLLKAGSAIWRFGNYYWGTPQYVRKGPPHIILRLLGPFVVVLSLTVIFSGLLLIVIAPSSLRNSLLFIHKVSFVFWFGAMAIHVLGHLGDTAREASLDWVGQKRRQIAGAGLRQLAEIGSLALGIGLAIWVTPYATAYATNWVIGGN
jgi:hypothetical protein